MRHDNRLARILIMLAPLFIAAGMALLASTLVVDAQIAPRKGAAESGGTGWPYPEPAQRGATGYSPDYAKYVTPSERWDIYVNILWRKAGSRNKADVEYYAYELSEFLGSIRYDDERAKLNAALHLIPLIQKIRRGAIKLPYRDARTGCLLFTVGHSGRRDLAADNCDGGR